MAEVGIQMTDRENTGLTTSDAPTAAALPHVLVLSGEIPQTRNAGAILLQRLFAGYGREAKDERGEAKLFVIGPKPHAEAEVLDCPYRELRLPLARLDNTRFSVLKRSLAARQLTPRPSHRKIINLLGEFRPEVLVCVMIDTPWMRVADRTARNLGIPLVLIVHDINEEFEKVFTWANKALFDANRQVYCAASRRLCVSPEMAEFLEQRYGVPGDVMYPNRSEELRPRALDDSLVLQASIQRHEARGERREESKMAVDSIQSAARMKSGSGRREGQASAPLTLGYAGSVAYGYGEALVDLIPVLREVGARILISTPRPPEKLKALLQAADVVEWMPHRADINDMWRTMQERADVMILPYSDPAGPHKLLYRTHFPSKLTEYLALGMPMIVSGPEEATGVRYAQGRKQETGDREKGGGNVDGKNDDIVKNAPNGAVACTTREELVAVLRRLTVDGELRRALAQQAVEAGKRDFDPGMIRKNFWNMLADVAG
jgi:glycosyltransferase involved in cell wall biosynthesis